MTTADRFRKLLGIPAKDRPPPYAPPAGPPPPGYGRRGPPDDPNLRNDGSRARFSTAPPYTEEPRDPALEQLETFMRNLGPGDLPEAEAARPSVFTAASMPRIGNQFGFRPPDAAPAHPAASATGAGEARSPSGAGARLPASPRRPQETGNNGAAEAGGASATGSAHPDPDPRRRSAGDEAKGSYRSLADEVGEEDVEPLLSGEQEAADDDTSEAGGSPDGIVPPALVDDAPKWKRKKWRRKLAKNNEANPLPSIPEAVEPEAAELENDARPDLTRANQEEIRAVRRGIAVRQGEHEALRAGGEAMRAQQLEQARQRMQAREARRRLVEDAQRQVGPLPPVPRIEYPAALVAGEWKDGRSLLEKAAMRKTGMGAKLEAVRNAFRGCATGETMFASVPSQPADPDDLASVARARKEVAQCFATEAERVTSLLNSIDDALKHAETLRGSAATLASARPKLDSVVQQLEGFKTRVEDRNNRLIHFGLLITLRNRVKEYEDAILPLFSQTATMEDARARFNGRNSTFQSLKMLVKSWYLFAEKIAGSRTMPFGPKHLEDTVPPLLASVVGDTFIANLQARVDKARKRVDSEIAALERSIEEMEAGPRAQEKPELFKELGEMLEHRRAMALETETRVVKQELDVLRSQVENDLPNAAVKLTDVLEWLQNLPEDAPAS